MFIFYEMYLTLLTIKKGGNVANANGNISNSIKINGYSATYLWTFSVHNSFSKYNTYVDI